MHKKNTDSYKYIFSLFLFYTMSMIIIYDNHNIESFYSKILITIILAILIDILLFINRKKYNTDKSYRFYTGLVLLIIYVVYGLSFRTLENHLLFGMTMSLAIIGASFFLDLELSTNEENVSENNGDK